VGAYYEKREGHGGRQLRGSRSTRRVIVALRCFVAGRWERENTREH
jgi:hypothetical protein